MSKVDTQAAAGTGPTIEDGTTVQPVADEYGRDVVVVAGGVTVAGGATEAEQQAQTALLTTIDSTLTGKLDVPISDLKTALVAANASLDAIEADADATATSTSTTATNTGTLITRVQDVEDRLQTLEGYVDGLEGLATSTNTKLDTLANASGATRFVSNGAAVSGTAKSGAGFIFSLYARNDNASTTLYLWGFDNTAASGTLVFAPIKLTAGAQLFLDTTYFTSFGHSLSTGFTWGFSTSGSSYSAHGTIGDCVISGLVK